MTAIEPEERTMTDPADDPTDGARLGVTTAEAMAGAEALGDALCSIGTAAGPGPHEFVDDGTGNCATCGEDWDDPWHDTTEGDR